MIVHSDRGSQPYLAAYHELIRAHHLRCSMSAQGNCYDNTRAVSFFHSLKVELIEQQGWSLLR